MNRNLFFAAAALFLWGFGEGMFFNFVPIYLDNQFLLGKYEIGLILGAFGFFMAVTHIPAGRLADRIGRKPLLIIRGFLFAQALVILFALFIWKGTTLPIFALGYFLLGGFRAARPMAMAQARELVHDSQMSVAYGTMETVSAIIFILAPPLAGFIFERDPFFVYPLAIGLIVVSIVVSYFFSLRKVAANA